MKYTQIQFEKELNTMLEEALAQGYTRLRVVAKELHDRVVKTKDNRMPLACNALWNLWRQQGSRDYRIIHTTKSGQSTTIEIEYHTI